MSSCKHVHLTKIKNGLTIGLYRCDDCYGLIYNRELDIADRTSVLCFVVALLSLLALIGFMLWL